MVGSCSIAGPAALWLLTWAELISPAEQQQVAKTLPGPITSFRMMRLPDPAQSGSGEPMVLG